MFVSSLKPAFELQKMRLLLLMMGLVMSMLLTLRSSICQRLVEQSVIRRNCTLVVDVAGALDDVVDQAADVDF